MPQRKLSCDENAEKITRKVSDLSFNENLILAPDKVLENGLLVNALSISVLPQGVVTSSDDHFKNSTFISDPLRVTGGDDTFSEYQDDVNVDFLSVSRPDNIESKDIFLSCHDSDDVSNESVGKMLIEQSAPFVNSQFISAPLRLTGGCDTSFEYHNVNENNSSTSMPDNIEHQDPYVSSPPEHNSHGVSNEAVGQTLMEQFVMPESESLFDNISGVEPPEMIDTDDSNARSLIDIDVSINENDDPKILLETLKSLNRDRPIIAHININFLSPKFEPLKDIIKDNIDILLVSETKLDDTYPDGQFFIEGYKEPIRLDRNKNGRGLVFHT